MPRLSEFLGIVISMYWNEGVHSAPHFHAEYGEHGASFAFDGSILRGSLPARQSRLVKRWAAEHQQELLKNWERARRREALPQIAPLS